MAARLSENVNFQFLSLRQLQLLTVSRIKSASRKPQSPRHCYDTLWTLERT
jgi:hypothetical protein